MKTGAEDKKKRLVAIVAGVLAIGAAAFMYDQLFGGTKSPPPPPPVIINNTAAANTPSPGAGNKTTASPPGFEVKGAAAKVGTTSGALDPTLHEEAMLNTESLVYSGTGRNIFSGLSEAPVQVAAIEKPVSGPRGPVLPPAPPVPCPPNCPPPPPPPPINLKFFGTSTSASGVRKAFLLQGDDVFLASTGDIVQRKYRIVSISASAILVEDIPNTNKQTLPLIPN